MAVDVSCGLNVGMAEERLDNSDILPFLNEPGGESMPQAVKVNVLNLCFHQDAIEFPLEVSGGHKRSDVARKDQIVVMPLPLPAALLAPEYLSLFSLIKPCRLFLGALDRGCRGL